MADLTMRIIQDLIAVSLIMEPDAQLKAFCGDYYSPYYNFFDIAGKYLKGEGVFVELGSETGRGLFGLALSGNEVVGIDTVKRERINAVQNEFPNVIFLNQASLPVPEWFDNNKAKIVLLHIDTEHSYAMAKAEFEEYQPYLIDNALVIFDDLHAMDDDVLKYFQSLPYEKIIDDRLHPTCGWGCLIYKK